MPKFRVIWNMNMEAVVEAEDEARAEEMACNLDPQYGGEYVEDSFEIVKVMNPGE